MCQVRKTRQLHLLGALCRRKPLAKHMPGPESPSHARPREPLTPAKVEQEPTVETDPSPSRAGKEEFRSAEFQQCGGGGMCRLLQRVSCCFPQSLNLLTVPRNEPCCPCQPKAVMQLSVAKAVLA